MQYKASFAVRVVHQNYEEEKNSSEFLELNAEWFTRTARVGFASLLVVEVLQPLQPRG
jgi:hypothetical protein